MALMAFSIMQTGHALCPLLKGSNNTLRGQTCGQKYLTWTDGRVRRGQALAPVRYQPSTTAPKEPLTIDDLPSELRKNVATLSISNPDAPEGKTNVYLLGMSHVSKKSSEQVAEVIRAVQPEVVVLELCVERVGLMVDPECPPPQIWHTRKVSIEGLSEEEGFPDESSVVSLLTCGVGVPVTIADIEADARRLLETGLFGSARPLVQPPLGVEAPEFLVEQDRVRVVAPFGEIRFVVEPRMLPPIQQFTSRIDAALDNTQLRDRLKLITESILAECEPRDSSQTLAETPSPAASGDESPTKSESEAAESEPAESEPAESESTAVADDAPVAVNTVALLMKARHKILEACCECGVDTKDVNVVFKGVDIGRVEAFIKAGPPSLTGLEGSAVNGEGWGIEPFKPSRQLFTLTSKNLRVDILPWLELASADSKNGAQTTWKRAAPSTKWRSWTTDEMTQDAEKEPEDLEFGDKVAKFFAGLLTGAFAKKQAAAGCKCGVNPGESWRMALEAAAQVGTQQIVLGDMPSSITGLRLARGVLRGVALNISGGVAVVAALIAASTNGMLPQEIDQWLLPIALAATGACVWPVAWPLIQIDRLAAMKGQQIEEAVEIKEQIQASCSPLALTGEDALLQWPGAMQPIIHDRDEFMAKTVKSAAMGVGCCPALVYDIVAGRPVWRYMMPQDGIEEVAPVGRGDGCYEGLKGVKNVVAVVGTAHVRGMISNWEANTQDLDVSNIIARGQ